MHRQALTGRWQFRQTGTKRWLVGTVPGGVHTDLLALGRIPDPFVGDNEKKVQWVAESDWEYRRIFIADKLVLREERLFLVCDGLDTLAEVWLNGHLLGRTDNMFRRWSWEVTRVLRAEKNDLHLLFRSPLAYIRSRQLEKPLQGGGDLPGGPYLRKAPYQWGWDWGPKLPPIGVWKEIRLEGYSRARLGDVHIRQYHRGDKVSLSIQAAVQTWGEQRLQVVATLKAPDGKTFVAEVEVNDQKAVAEIEVPEPHLWWPNDSGEHPLYALQVDLQEREACLDQRSYQLGLRTIELRQQPDQWGESFTFVVNGVPIFAKGADWIPADSFPTRVSAAHLENLIRSASEAHMNMLRIWGGGFYEQEPFYELCDRYGILIWQDFAFACGIYPEDDRFFANVRLEALENIRRLHHHACLALWCGNNEMEQGWSDWGWNRPSDPANQRLKAAYDRMFHHLLPELLAAEDPDHPYWPSSASSGIAFADPNGQQRGDTHYWEVWHGGKPFSAYREQFPRFMSEFGFQGLPPYRTIQAYAAPEDQNLTSYVMEHHQRSREGNGLMIAQLTKSFRLPKDFQSWVYLSMVLQAEGIRTGVEHWRRHPERVSGTLFWQLNDCWPVASWSSIDYFGRWKALHYVARRFYAPVLLSVEEDGSRMRVFVTNDTPTPWKGELRWSLESVTGRRLKGGTASLAVPGLSATPVSILDFASRITEANKRQLVFVCELWQARRRRAQQTIAFVPDKHLELKDPQIRSRLSVNGRQLSIRLQSRCLARFVQLELAGADVIFSDNYFDLPAGRVMRVSCPLPPRWSLKQARRALKVRSYYESY
ncbi:MAG: glycoside hydrolase family 2 protein [Anaerolineales bacterium]|jgi:beta-mannosidase